MSGDSITRLGVRVVFSRAASAYVGSCASGREDLRNSDLKGYFVLAVGFVFVGTEYLDGFWCLDDAGLMSHLPRFVITIAIPTNHRYCFSSERFES